MKERIGPLVDAARRHGFVLTVAGIAAAGILVAILLSASATRRAEAWEREVGELERVLREADRWATGFVPATAAESLAWRRSERRLEELALEPGAAVSVATEVTRVAERLGILEPTVRVERADTMADRFARDVDGREITYAPAVIHVEVAADYATVVRFIGALPAPVRVRALDFIRTEDGLRARLLLAFLQDESAGDGGRTRT